MKRIIILIILLAFSSISFGYDSIHSGAQIDAEITRGINRQTTIGSPGSDNNLVTEQAVAEALELKESKTSNDIDPDRLNGDNLDNNKIDADIINYGTTAGDSDTLTFHDFLFGAPVIGYSPKWNGTNWIYSISGGNVTSTNIPDNRVPRGDGGGTGFQSSDVTIEDDGNITTPGVMEADKIVLSAKYDPGMSFDDNMTTVEMRDWHIWGHCVNATTGHETIRVYLGSQKDSTFTTWFEIQPIEGLFKLLGGLDFVTTGKVMGGINVVKKSAAYTINTDNAYEAYGTMFINSDNDTQPWTLPAISGNMHICFQNGTNVACAMNATAVANNNIVLDGDPTAANGTIESTGAKGDAICLYASNSTTWCNDGLTGEWGIP